MRSLAAEEITGLEGNLRSTRTILQKVHVNFNYLQQMYTTTAVQWMCKSKRFPYTSSFMKQKKNISYRRNLPFVCVRMLFGFKGGSTKQELKAKDA